MKVRVDLVPVVASVLDPEGRPVPDLPREDFEVYDQGQQQRIDLFQRQTDLPLDLALMIDTSLSTFTELKFEREAASHFIREVLRPGDLVRLAVFEFSLNVSQLSQFSGNLEVLDGALKDLIILNWHVSVRRHLPRLARSFSPPSRPSPGGPPRH